MFLSMLVAWLIPDVPRSLREQLKKENMALMEFLLNQDQEACAKTHSPKPSIPCLSANIDIVVEAPSEDEEVHQEEGEEEVRVEISLDDPGGTDNSKADVTESYEETADNQQEEVGDEARVVEEEQEKEKDEVKEESENREEKRDEEKEEGGQSKEGDNEDEVKGEEENFTVDLDSFMSELGLLGKRTHFSFSNIHVKIK